MVVGKLIIAEPGEGAQYPHYDCETWDEASRRFSVLIYMVPTRSTVMCSLPSEIVDPVFSREVGDPTPGEERLARELIIGRNFVSFPVQAGTVAVMAGKVCHYAPPNTHKQDQRIAYYLLFSPDDDKKEQDEHQRFPLDNPDNRTYKPLKEVKKHVEFDPAHYLRPEVVIAAQRRAAPPPQPPISSTSSSLSFPSTPKSSLAISTHSPHRVRPKPGTLDSAYAALTPAQFGCRSS